MLKLANSETLGEKLNNIGGKWKRPSHAVESLENILGERGSGGKLLEKSKYSIPALVVEVLVARL